MPAGLPRRLRGFTLIEILVVCAIMAIVATLAAVRLEQSDASRLRDAAEELTRRLEAARDEAVIRGRPIAFSSDGQGYQFWLAGDNTTWMALPGGDGWTAGRFSRGVELSAVRVNGAARPLGERVVFSPFALVEPFTLTLAAGSSRVEVQADALGRFETQHAQ